MKPPPPDLARARRLRAIDQTLAAELATAPAVAARLADALANTPDDGDGCAFLPADLENCPDEGGTS